MNKLVFLFFIYLLLSPLCYAKTFYCPQEITCADSNALACRFAGKTMKTSFWHYIPANENKIIPGHYTFKQVIIKLEGGKVHCQYLLDNRDIFFDIYSNNIYQYDPTSPGNGWGEGAGFARCPDNNDSADIKRKLRSQDCPFKK